MHFQMCNFKKFHLSLPLQHFADYLHRGYYPFSDRHISIYVQQMVNATIENDIPQYAVLTVSTARKLKRLLSIVAQIATPNSGHR